MNGSVTNDLYMLGLLVVGFGALGVLASWRAALRATGVEPAAASAEPGR